MASKRRRGSPVDGEALAKFLSDQKCSVEECLKRTGIAPTVLKAALTSGVHGADVKRVDASTNERFELSFGRPMPRLPDGTLESQVSRPLPVDADAIQTMERFYECTAAKDYPEAWELLSVDFKRRFKLGLEGFVRGYSSFRGLTNLVVAPLPRTAIRLQSAIVYYEDDVAVPAIPLLQGVRGYTLGLLDEFANRLGAIRERLVDYPDWKSIEIIKLIGLDGPAILKWKLNIPDDVFERLFDTAESLRRPLVRVYRLTCVWHEPNWRIDGILPVRFGDALD